MEEIPMKRIVSIVLAAVMLMAVMCIPAFAVDESNKSIRLQVYMQDQTAWKWVPAFAADGNEVDVALGETKEIVYTGDNWRKEVNRDTTGYQYGMQVLDMTLDQNVAVVGDKSTIVYEISDVTFKATGYEDYVAKVAGEYTANLDCYEPDWGGIAGNSTPHAMDGFDKVAGSTPAEIQAYMDALTEIRFTLTYKSYNGETAAPAADDTAAPADDTTAPADDATEPTPSVDTTEPADTGIVLALLPMAVAAAAVVASKRK